MQPATTRTHTSQQLGTRCGRPVLVQGHVLQAALGVGASDCKEGERVDRTGQEDWWVWVYVCGVCWLGGGRCRGA
jgi:hypothetical protein